MKEVGRKERREETIVSKKIGEVGGWEVGEGWIETGRWLGTGVCTVKGEIWDAGG